MPAEIKIPFGYKRVSSQIQKGDGVWNAATQKFDKVRKEYPRTDDDRVFIRRCEVRQTELPVSTEPTITVHDGNGNNPTKPNSHGI